LSPTHGLSISCRRGQNEVAYFRCLTGSCALLRLITQGLLMADEKSADDYRAILRAMPLPRATLQDEEWWAEKIKPSRRRNLTPLQRQQRLEALKELRAGVWEKTTGHLTPDELGTIE
jgi:hypothetical protein